jgi:hypothetical protein
MTELRAAMLRLPNLILHCVYRPQCRPLVVKERYRLLSTVDFRIASHAAAISIGRIGPRGRGGPFLLVLDGLHRTLKLWMRLWVQLGWAFVGGMGLSQYVWLSYAPMSQPVVSPPPGRGRPRWSVFRRLPEKSRQPAGLPASSAGLPFCSAIV